MRKMCMLKTSWWTMSCCYPLWKHKHSALAFCTLLEMLDVFSLCVAEELSVAPNNCIPLFPQQFSQHQVRHSFSCWEHRRFTICIFKRDIPLWWTYRSVRIVTVNNTNSFYIYVWLITSGNTVYRIFMKFCIRCHTNCFQDSTSSMIGWVTGILYLRL